MTKIGSNTLTLAGSTGNSYTGDTNVAEGILLLSKLSGLAIPGNLNLSALNGTTETRVQGDDQISSSTVINFLGGSNPCFELFGHAVTVAGISDFSAPA